MIKSRMMGWACSMHETHWEFLQNSGQKDWRKT